MARNWEKYMYVELAIPRNSAWFPLLEAEAAAKGQSLAQVTLERLAAIYLRESQLSGMSRATTILPAVSTSKASPLNQASEAEPEEEAEPHLNDHQAANNAAAFLDNGGFI